MIRKLIWRLLFAKGSHLCLRSDVMLRIDEEIWNNRDRHHIVRILQDLQTRI